MIRIFADTERYDWNDTSWKTGVPTTPATTLSGTTEQKTAGYDLSATGADGFTLYPEVDFDSTPTDNVEVKIYGSYDGSDWADTPFHTYTISKDTDPNLDPEEIVTGFPHVQFGVVQDGSTDSHEVSSIRIRTWTWGSA